MVRHLTQEEAINVDLDLFNTYKFSVYQLMELAGMSCAHSVSKCYPVTEVARPVLILCGPGNNGGDGLVMARHLQLLGYTPKIFYPKRTDNELYKNLVVQAELSDISFIDTLPTTTEELAVNYSLLIDCVFGFSFKPPVRAQFSPILEALANCSLPLVCVDIPSGWDVELGPPTDGATPALNPDLLVSLTAPKKCAQYFTGRFHYLGGRFIPSLLADKYNLDLPTYPDTQCCVKLS